MKRGERGERETSPYPPADLFFYLSLLWVWLAAKLKRLVINLETMEVHWLQDLTDEGLDGECVGSGVYLCDSNMSASHSAPWTGQRSTGSARNLHPKQINKKRWCQLSSRWTQRFGGCHLWKFLLGISVILPYLILAAQRSVLKPGPDKSVACEVTFTDFTKSPSHGSVRRLSTPCVTKTKSWTWNRKLHSTLQSGAQTRKFKCWGAKLYCPKTRGATGATGGK